MCGYRKMFVLELFGMFVVAWVQAEG